MRIISKNIKVATSLCAAALLNLKLSPLASAASLTTLANFDGPNGAYPQSNLIFDSSGNLYGTTTYGAVGWTGPSHYGSGYGEVFKVAAKTNALTTLAFSSSSAGNPIAGLIADGVGNLFGATSAAGVESLGGSVYEVAAGSNSLTTLASFNGVNGYSPVGGLYFDSQGNIYGASAYGGTGYTGGAYSGYGTVYEVPAGSHAINTVAAFNGTDGQNPEGPLIADAFGNLYGTEAHGGTHGYGSVFEVSATTHAIMTVASFNSANGNTPTSGLVADSAGNLYGTTEYGGSNGDGTVFEVSANSDVITTLTTFTGANGSIPVSGLIFDTSDNLYGTTDLGGANSDGTVFEISANNHALTTLFSFNGADGASPYCSLISDAAGNLYGTTRLGGANDVGTAFELSGTDFVVPEPASVSLLSLALIGLLTRRQRD